MHIQGFEARPGFVGAWGGDVGDRGVEGEGCGVVEEGVDWVCVVLGVWVCYVGGLVLVLVLGDVQALVDVFGACGG